MQLVIRGPPTTCLSTAHGSIGVFIYCMCIHRLLVSVELTRWGELGQ